MARPEPFRALLEEALASESSESPAAPGPGSAPPSDPFVTPMNGLVPIPSSENAPLTVPGLALSQRLDALPLAGVTPPRGMKKPAAAPKQAAAPIAIAEVPAELPVTLPRPPVMTTAAPAPVEIKPVERKPAPPPLPRKATPAPVMTASPLTAPVPKVAQILDDDTHPMARTTEEGASSSPSGNAKIADLYRLQLEFEDTPARPLPKNASVPLPVVNPFADNDPTNPIVDPALVDALAADAPADEPTPLELSPLERAAEPGKLGGIESTDLSNLVDADGIADLELLAQAMGMKSLDVSIPSYDGEPVNDEVEGDDLDLVAQKVAPQSDPGRKAMVLEALGGGVESVFPSQEDTPVEPALMADRVAVPVIVKIPSRPKVTAEAREQARRLYLTALDELAKGDRVGAVGHLKLAIHYDDATQLYGELLVQLEKRAVKAPPRDEPPALTVTTLSGKLRRPREIPRFR